MDLADFNGLRSGNTPTGAAAEVGLIVLIRDMSRKERGSVGTAVATFSLGNL